MPQDAEGEWLRGFSGRRVFLTGDTGFKGSWLALWLADLGAEVTGYALPPLPGNILFPAVRPLIRHINGDIRDPEALSNALGEARPEIVFHLAAQSLVRRSYAEPQPTFATNLLGSVNLLEAVRLTESVRALVYVTTDKCYRNREWVWGYRENDELGGRDPYSASKAAAELAFEAYRQSFFVARPGLGAASARAGNVIGGGDQAEDRIVPDTIAALEAGRPVALRNPGAVRSWMHVLDPLHGYLQLATVLLAEPQKFSGPWNFGPEEEGIRTVEELVRALIGAWGAGEIAHAPAPDAPHEAALLHLSSEKARRELGWRSRWGFERAASETAGWYKQVRAGASPLDASRVQLQEYVAGRQKQGADD
jgi:CDP-glucose 4,6-dehydratase